MKKRTLLLIALFGLMTIAFAQNMALNFDGIVDYVDCGNGTSLQITGSITLEAWIYPTAFGAYDVDNTIVSKVKPSPTDFNGYLLRCGGAGILNFSIGNGSAWYMLASPTGVLALNTWSHVAGVYDGSTMRIYVNGVSVASYLLSITIGTNIANNLKIGIQSETPSPFQGKIDEVRIWNVARSITDIPNNMYKELVGNEAGFSCLL